MKRMMCLSLAFVSSVVGAANCYAGVLDRVQPKVNQAEQAKVKTREQAVADALRGQGKQLTPEQKAEKEKKIKAIGQILEVQSKKLFEVMGGDKEAKIAVAVILEALAGKDDGSIPDALKDLCKTQEKCPMEMDKFYRESIAKIPAKEFGNAKTLLQRAMLASNLPGETKVAILKSTLNSPDVYQNQTPTKFSAEGIPVLGQDSNLIVNTQDQLFKLRPSPQEALRVTEAAVKNTPDQMTKLILIRNLGALYPQYAPTYRQEFARIGAIQPSRGK